MIIINNKGINDLDFNYWMNNQLTDDNIEEILEGSDLSMEQLRKNITSKGGTTQAGLDALSQYDLVAVFEDCLSAAVNRSVELSNTDD